jgi:1-deoxy-D-xylulose-5-phosphate synthase
MQRAYDNVIHDVALQELNVIFCLDRAGVVGSDGATHHGLFDLAYMRCIPNMKVSAPRNEIELRNLLYTAQLTNMGPFVIRYPRGKGYIIDWKQPMKALEIGKGEKLKEGKDLAILTLGTIANSTTKAIELIEKEHAISIAHYDLRFLKPLDQEMMHEIAKNFKHIITLEEGVIQGGFGSAVLEFISDNGYDNQVKRLGMPDSFIEHGTPEELMHMLGLDAEGIAQSIESWLEKTKSIQFEKTAL